MHRRAALPLRLVWLLTVLATWLLTTISLLLLIAATGHAGIAGLVGQSALSAALACVVVGGPATAAALHVLQGHGLGQAVLTGLSVAALILVFIWSYMAASGIGLQDAWSAITPALVVTAVQLGLAFALRGRRPAPPPTPPAEPADPAE